MTLFCPTSAFLAPFWGFFSKQVHQSIFGGGEIYRKFYVVDIQVDLKAFHKILSKYSLISEVLFQHWNQTQAMKGGSPLGLAIFSILGYVRSEKESRQIGCQQRSTSGRDYLGEANTTIDGISCQRWSETQPHDHDFTHVGDHNFCRNLNGASQSQVWCFTTDPKIQS